MKHWISSLRKVFGFLFFFLCFISLFFFYTRRQIKINRSNITNLQRQKNLSQGYLSQNSIPFCIGTVPKGETTGLILDVKTIQIRGVEAPYNASIVSLPDEEGFLLFFRYDQVQPPSQIFGLPFTSHIGCVKLDPNFRQTENYKEIQLENTFNEDPRALWHQNELYLSYNSLCMDPSGEARRIIKLAKLDYPTLTVKEELHLDVKKQKIEKNWTPFSYSSNGNEHLLFKYYLIRNENFLFSSTNNSHVNCENSCFGKKYRLCTTARSNQKKHPAPLSCFLQEMSFPQTSHHNLSWHLYWGEPRGGTPALRIDENTYLAFFHSSFLANEQSAWYIMGAYTFEAAPPFRITAISHYPILFEKVFTSPISNTANPMVRCVFPAGFVVKKVEGKEIIYLSIGENDSCTKILTLDKKSLLSSLKRLDAHHRAKVVRESDIDDDSEEETSKGTIVPLRHSLG